MDERTNYIMADTLIAGTTLVEKESRSIGDVPVGGIVEFDETLFVIPDGYMACDGATVTDPLSSYNGTAVPNLNTEYLNTNGSGFTPRQPDVNDINYGNTNGSATASADGIIFLANVELPHGAVITSVIVHGNAGATAETWTLIEVTIAGANVTMATANIGTADTSITNPTIDNSTKSYTLITSSIDTNDTIYGSIIIYTPRKKFIIRIK